MCTTLKGSERGVAPAAGLLTRRVRQFRSIGIIEEGEAAEMLSNITDLPHPE